MDELMKQAQARYFNYIDARSAEQKATAAEILPDAEPGAQPQDTRQAKAEPAPQNKMEEVPQNKAASDEQEETTSRRGRPRKS